VVSFVIATSGLSLLIFYCIVTRRKTRTLYSTNYLPYHALRGVATTIISVIVAYSAPRLPLDQLYLYFFTGSLWIVIISHIVFPTKIKTLELLSVLIGFFVILVNIKFKFATLSTPAILVLLSVPIYALGSVITRKIPRSEGYLTISFYPRFFAFLSLGLIMVYNGWKLPEYKSIMYLASASIFGTYGIIGTASAFQFARASFIAPWCYIQFPVGVLIGYLAFNQAPTRTTILASVIVIFSGLLTLYSDRFKRQKFIP
jgi:drug/metabolite transporter (DMT)-like permease